MALEMGVQHAVTDDATKALVDRGVVRGEARSERRSERHSERRAESPVSIVRLAGRLALVAMAAYSIALVVAELRTSQDWVRHYFTDIRGPRPFYGINTTLSAGLLWGAAVLFAAAQQCVPDGPGASFRRRLLAAQALAFAYLAVDERFLVHERVAFRLGIGDHWVLLAVAVVVAGLVAVAVRETRPTPRARWRLGAACVLFVVMLGIDALLPEDMVLRLSLEDLAKTWGALCFMLFAWESLRGVTADLQHRTRARVDAA